MTTPTIGLTPKQVSRLTPREKRYYLLALITMASSDEDLAPEELDLIRSRARELDWELIKTDLNTYDIEEIARTIQKPSVQEALFQDLVLMGQADRKWHPEEIKILRYFADSWGKNLPPLNGVDWGKVSPPTASELEETSVRKRESLLSPQNQEIVKSASPGTRWGWVFAATGIYIGLIVTFTILIYVLRDGQEEAPGELNLANTLAGLISCFMTGVIVGVASPGRTLKEPVIGVLLPLIAYSVALMVAAIKYEYYALIIAAISAIGIAGLVQFTLAMIGAWLGEKISESR